VRRLYRRLLSEYFSRGKGDPARRRKFILEELTRYTESITRAVQASKGVVTPKVTFGAAVMEILGSVHFSTWLELQVSVSYLFRE
jgi:hypothetical protein